MVKKKNLKNLREWAKNISYNYNHDIDTNVYNQLKEASDEESLNFSKIDKKWQDTSLGNSTTSGKIFQILKAGI